MVTSDGPMALQIDSINHFFQHKKDVVEFVNDLLSLSQKDWQSITITRQAKSQACCVSIVTNKVFNKRTYWMVCSKEKEEKEKWTYS